VKPIVNEESEPQMGPDRYAEMKHAGDSHLQPLLLLLETDSNGADRAAALACLFKAPPPPNITGAGNNLPTTVSADDTKQSPHEAMATGETADESDLSRLQAQLAQVQRMDALGKLAQSIAHDVNNLLMVVTSHSELLLGRTLDGKSKHHMERVLDAARRAGKLTRQLLDFSRDHAIQTQVLSLNVIVHDLREVLACLAGKMIRLELALEEPLDLCEINAVQLQQVLMNLVVNARDAMPEGGRLLIETGNVEIESTACGSAPDAPGRFVTLCVSDTGVGMDDRTKERMFQPFFTTKDAGRGTGLGLSTVYDIVKQSGGRISVDSQIGCGTRFRVYLPALAESSAP
jgi:two-component system cell cycle sensor histidine kinase/response regulator CckA